jgi:hypothetical protein
MSRLDSFIRRMSAQRACIDHAASLLHALPGPVLELGLGNGRTYDHLRQSFPGRDIFVFDFAVAAHPACIPAPRYLRLGDFRTTVPAFRAEGHPLAAFVHADVGSGSEEASRQLAAELALDLCQLLAPGAMLACDQPMLAPGLQAMPLPSGVDSGRYHIYQRVG